MSCKSRIFTNCILSGEALPFEFNWTNEFAIRWAPNSGYPAFSVVRPSTADRQTGLEYVSEGGQSGPEEPEWPTTDGETVVDGSTIWTAQPLSNASLRERINTVTWPPVSGFTISPETAVDEPGRQLTAAKIGSDTASVIRKNIKVEVVTTEGNEYVGIIKMKVE